MSGAGVVAIKHVNKTRFSIDRLSDGKSCKPVAVPSPYEFPVEGLPNSNLMRELRWYLEEFLDYPFHPETVKAEHVLKVLQGWGTAAFTALFGKDDRRSWLIASDTIQVRSDDAQVLSWPWEGLYDPKANYVGHRYRVERRLNELDEPAALADLPTDRVNILLVVARPYEDDVGYRSIARPLVEMIREKGLPAHVDVLRPPTFDRLREHLRERRGYYHVLHFDGHGAFGDVEGELESKGCLVFEDENGEEDVKSATDLSTLLREYAVPAVVLNACQSGMFRGRAESPFVAVATALLQGGMRSVVAMAYSLYVSGAQVFLPAFYRRLFEGNVAEAVRAGRQQMVAHKGRVCARELYPLEDWLLPVLYQQDPLDFSFATQAKVEALESRLPEEVREHRDPYGFVGRDGAILAMERALHRKTPAILLQGLGGVGKTTLARGFLRWLDETGGIDDALWFDFRDIRSAEYVINQVGQRFCGENFGVAKNKLALLGKALRDRRVVMVWDNFESSAANLSDKDRDELGRFLDEIRGGRGKVIITSRSPEEWLGATRRFELKLGGLDGEERWEYCEIILRELGLRVDRDEAALVGLMEQLAGHPLAMRVVLPKVAEMGAAKVAAALRSNIAELGLSEQEEQGRLFGTLRFVELGLAAELRPLLGLVGLHEGFVTAALLELMAKQVDAGWTRERIDRLVAALGRAGLVRDVGNATYEMHPLLTSYLRSRGEAAEASQRAFVRVMGSLADSLAPKELHEQRFPFFLHGANFHYALAVAEGLVIDQAVAALTQSLAYAQNSRDFSGAKRLFEGLAKHHAAREEFEGEAGAYHQLGMIAQEQRDFVTAREWYLKSLAISEQQGNLHGAASTYHQLGRIAEEQRDFATAREWYLKTLAIDEQQGNLHGAASTFHQLGMIAEEQREFAMAREWYLKSLAIKERQGNLHGAASTYHQLGMIAEKQRDFATAREWYLKSLAIAEQQGNLYGAAITYHQLGLLAQEQRDFAAAREWYLKSLAISEQQGNLHGAAITYHQLGSIAQEQRDFATAREWYLKSLAIAEQQGDLHSAASTYHQLGMIAEEQRDFATAREWYLKSLAIKEQQGNLHGAAITYHQLGMIAAEQRDFATAREWYLKSLAIEEQQGNLHGAAITYHQLGVIAQEQGDFVAAREWYLKSLAIEEQQGNLHGAAITYHQLGNLAGTRGRFRGRR